MSSPTADLTRLLVQFSAPGYFARRRTAPCNDLCLDVKGVDRITLLIPRSSSAPPACSRAMVTRARRGSIAASATRGKFRSSYPDPRNWNRTLQPHLDGMCRELGLPGKRRREDRDERADHVVGFPGV
jgi:hypothetical protein